MGDLETFLSIGLGGTSLISVVAYILYSWSKGTCSSHLKMGETELKLDINTIEEVKEVFKEASDEKEREKIREELKKDLQKTLHRVKSRLKNRLESSRERTADAV